MNYIYYTIISITAVSLVSFAGLFTLSLKKERLQKITYLLVSLSAGTLLGDSLLHLMPEALEKLGTDYSVWLILIVGFIVFFVLEKLVCWRHCHVPTSENHPHPLGSMNLIGDAVHNFLDGAVIAGSFLISIPVGVATTIAVITHEIPQEISDLGVLIYAGYSRNKALYLNFLTALTSFAGAFVGFTIFKNYPDTEAYLLPFAAGGFLYIAAADLIPELQKHSQLKKSFFELFFISLGVAIMIALLFVE